MIISRHEAPDDGLMLSHDKLMDYTGRDEWSEIMVSQVMFTAGQWSANMSRAAQLIAEARALMDEIDDESAAAGQIISKLWQARKLLDDINGGVSTYHGPTT